MEEEIWRYFSRTKVFFQFDGSFPSHLRSIRYNPFWGTRALVMWTSDTKLVKEVLRDRKAFTKRERAIGPLSYLLLNSLTRANDEEWLTQRTTFTQMGKSLRLYYNIDHDY